NRCSNGLHTDGEELTGSILGDIAADCEERETPERSLGGLLKPRISSHAAGFVLCRRSLMAASSWHAAAIAKALTNLLALAGPAVLWMRLRSSGESRKANTTKFSSGSGFFGLEAFLASRLAMIRSASPFRSGFRRGILRGPASGVGS